MIVIARYNEDIEWSKQFSNVLIYNKGDIIKDISNQILLPNVGRDGHTYFKYIYDNYDNLEVYTIFLQGNPFDHSSNIINNLYKYINNGFNKNFEFLCDLIIDCNLTGCKYHSGLPLQDIYKKLFNRDIDNLAFKFGSGAQYIVSKEQILKRPRNFYLKIVTMLEYNINPIEGYVIERFAELIFSE